MPFFACTTIPDPGVEVALDESESHHVAAVLRHRTGDLIGLVDGRGRRASAEITSVSGNPRRPRVRCRILTCETVPRPAPAVRLLVAAPKAKAMALLVRQAVELGVEHVVPVQCRFSVAEVRADWAERRGAAECWAAAKQSGNPWLPTVSAPVSFAAALDLTSGESNLFGAVPDHEFSAAESVPDLHRAAMLNVWVGPEGGFAPEERLAFTERGFLAVRIGPYTLRVETAVVALLSWIRGPGRRDP